MRPNAQTQVGDVLETLPTLNDEQRSLGLAEFRRRVEAEGLSPDAEPDRAEWPGGSAFQRGTFVGTEPLQRPDDP